MSVDTTSLIPNFVPSGYKTVNIHLAVKDAHHALDFYNRAFGAEVVNKLENNGVVEYAEFRIHDTIIMLSEENPAYNKSPTTLGGTSVVIQIYTGDAEEMFDDACKAGCEVIFPMKLQFYGDKAGRVQDPFGHQWIIARSVEQLTASELQRRYTSQQ
jgi:PhnB protein